MPHDLHNANKKGSNFAGCLGRKSVCEFLAVGIEDKSSQSPAGLINLG